MLYGSVLCTPNSVFLANMPTYIYKARDATGKLIKGAMESASKEELTAKLRKMGYLVSRITEALPGIKIDSLSKGLLTISTEDMVIFTVQLSNMINAGLTLLSSLKILAQQTENKRLQETIANVSRNVETGDSFSEALSKHPKVFSKLFISMVKAGEASGKLDMILSRLAIFMEQQADLRQKIKSALFYPAILLITGLTVTLYIVTVVVPQFAEIFVKVGIELPLPTLLLYQIGTAIKRFWYLLPLGAFGAWILVRSYAATVVGRWQVDRLKLRLPILGRLFRKVAISRFARTLGMLVAAGVPILQALDIVKETMDNEVLSRVVATVRTAVERGEKIFESLRISQEFPMDTVQMISVGEETGDLDDMLGKIADFYDLAIGYTIKKLISLIEPIFLCILGGLVGLIMASMLLPIFDMMKVLRAVRH